jgi:hypothetical protein
MKTSKKMKGFTKLEIAIVLIFIWIAVSWVFNLIKLTHCDFEAPYKCEIIHGIGIIPPVALVTAHMNFKG